MGTTNSGLANLAAKTQPLLSYSFSPVRQDELTLAVVHKQIEAMHHSGLHHSGYRHLIIPELWQQRDVNGQLQPVSALGSLPEIVALLAEAQISLGVHLSPGRKTCGQRRHPSQYVGQIGSMGYEQTDLAFLSAAGVKSVHLDWCMAGINRTGLERRPTFTAWGKANKALPQPLHLAVNDFGVSLPWTWGSELLNSARTHRPLRRGVKGLMAAATKTGSLPAPGKSHYFHDAGPITIGVGAATGVRVWSQMAIWALLASPLTAHGDLRSITPDERLALIDPVLLAINQAENSAPAIHMASGGGISLWVRQVTPQKTVVLVVNTTNKSRDLDFARLAAHSIPEHTIGRGHKLRLADGDRPWRELLTLPPYGAVLVHDYETSQLRYAANAVIDAPAPRGAISDLPPLRPD